MIIWVQGGKNACLEAFYLLKCRKFWRRTTVFTWLPHNFFVKRGGKSSKLQRMSEAIIFSNFCPNTTPRARTIAESVAAQVQASFDHVKLWWEEKVARTEVRASRQTEQM